MIRKIFGVLALALLAGAFAACETVEGVGRDTQNLGEGIENASEGVQR